MTQRQRTRTRGAAAGALAVGLVALGATSAQAVPQDLSDALQTTWAGPTVNLGWDGRTYTSATQSFVGTPVSVPGDIAGRTLTVVNDGPCGGTLRGWIVNVNLLDPGAPDVHHNSAHVDPDGSGAATGDPYKGAGDQGNFYDDLTLRWRTASETDSADFTSLAATNRSQILEMPIARGGSTTITLVYEFPFNATSGNGANVAERRASFDAYLEIKGDDCEPDVPPDEDEDSPGDGGPLAETGAAVGWLGLVSVLLILGGAATRGAARRRTAREDSGRAPLL
jgi:hypothetical protein